MSPAVPVPPPRRPGPLVGGAAGAVAVVLALAGGCRPSLRDAGGPNTYRGLLAADERTYARSSLLGVLWMERLIPQEDGPYVPVERSAPALDPAEDRVYVGTTEGFFYALTSGGRRVYRFDANGSIESTPAFDRRRDELYFGTEQGRFISLRASDGVRRWASDVRGPVRTSAVLSDDAVYVVTHDDEVFALSREDGSVLWEYARSREGEGFSISEHAGVTLTDDLLLTGFTDGSVVAFDAAEGSVRWIRDTSTDLVTDIRDSRPRFFDVDTTPVVVDSVVYAASFAGGLYALERSNGGVIWRDKERTGVTRIAPDTAGMLLLASADEGMIRYDPTAQRALWTTPLDRGTPSGVAQADGLVLTGGSRGAFVALDLENGRELARFEGSAGFTAPPVVGAGLGFVLSNDGAFYCFRAGRRKPSGRGVRASAPRP